MMGLDAPKLDDRAFADLMEEARRRIALYCPEWTDHNISDPGITLLELFAWMTDIVLYRLNRVPDKHYIKMMELVGMQLHDAEPARVPVTFWLSAPQETNITVPQGTEVSTTRTESDPAIVFSTDLDAEIRVPTLQHIMTRANDTRQVRSYDVNGLRHGSEKLNVFGSTPPQAGDVLYLGFKEDLSHHLLAIEMELTEAQGAGVDPTNPPYEWEVLGFDEDNPWSKADVEQDTTAGFNQNGMMRLLLPRMQQGVRNDQTAYWLRCRLAPDEGEYSYDVSPRVSRLIAASWGITVETTNVTTVRGEVLGRSDGTPGQLFELEHAPVAPRIPGELLIVRDDQGRETRWQEVSDFATSTADDHHYTLDSKTGTLRLGPALPQRDGTVRRYGALPPKGSIVIMRAYRYGGGVRGNVGRNTINVSKSSLPYIAKVANRQSARGGLDVESLADAKLRVPGHLRSLQRAVTASDYQYLTKEAAPGQVGRVHCLQPPYVQVGEVKVLVIPTIPELQRTEQIAPESLYLSEQIRERIELYLDARRLISTRLEVAQPQYQWVQVSVRLHASDWAEHSELRRAVRGKLFEFINPLIGGATDEGWAFGRALYNSDVMAALLRVPGVDFIRSVTLYPVYQQADQFVRGQPLETIDVPPDGILVSYDHDVQVD